MDEIFELASASVFDFSDSERAVLETIRADFSYDDYPLILKIHPGKDGAVAQLFQGDEKNFIISIAKRPIKDGLIFDVNRPGQIKDEYHAFSNVAVNCRRIMNERKISKVVFLSDFVRAAP